jgi:hypothetical protein
MKRLSFVIVALFAGFTYISPARAADDLKPWEKFGLSQTEWKMILDNRIPEAKIHELLQAGIGIGEYVARPWEKLGLSEREWIAKRRSGLTNYDIELEAGAYRRSAATDSNKSIPPEVPQVSESKGLFVAFAVPGLQQARLGEKWRSRIMGGVAIGSVAGCLIGSIAKGGFEPIPLCFLVPDMFWSFFDYKVAVAKRE